MPTVLNPYLLISAPAIGPEIIKVCVIMTQNIQFYNYLFSFAILYSSLLESSDFVA